MGLVAVLGVASFIISFRALYDVAAWAGLGSSIQWAVPVFIDGAILTYALAVLVHRSRGEPTWPSWLSLAVFTAMSIAANAAHALSVPQQSQGQAVIGAGVAAMAPLGVFAATEQMARLVVLRPKDRDAAAADPLPATGPAMAEESPAEPVAEQPAGGADARDDAVAALPVPVADLEPEVPCGAERAETEQSPSRPVPATTARPVGAANPVAEQWQDDAAPVPDDDRAQPESEARQEPERVEDQGAEDDDDGFAAWVLEQRQRGLPVTGPTAGQFLDVSERTGRNRIKELRAARPELFEEVPA